MYSVCDIAAALKLVRAVAAVVPAVPPLAIGNCPVTPVVSGRPVQLVSVPLEGVPSTGVVSVGLVSVLFVNVSVVARPTIVSLA